MTIQKYIDVLGKPDFPISHPAVSKNSIFRWMIGDEFILEVRAEKRGMGASSVVETVLIWNRFSGLEVSMNELLIHLSNKELKEKFIFNLDLFR